MAFFELDISLRSSRTATPASHLGNDRLIYHQLFIHCSIFSKPAQASAVPHCYIFIVGYTRNKSFPTRPTDCTKYMHLISIQKYINLCYCKYYMFIPGKSHKSCQTCTWRIQKKSRKRTLHVFWPSPTDILNLVLIL